MNAKIVETFGPVDCMSNAHNELVLLEKICYLRWNTSVEHVRMRTSADKIQARMNISQESEIFHLSTDCRIEVYT